MTQEATRTQRATDVIIAAGLLGLGSVLALTGTGLLEQWRTASDHHQDVAVEDLVGLAAALAGAGLLIWWFASLACAAAGLVLSRTGQARAASAALRLSPAFMQRLVVTVFSFQVIVSGAAHAAAPGPQWTPTQGQEVSSPAYPDQAETGLDQMGADSGPGHGSAQDRVPASVRGDVPAAPPASVYPGWTPSAPVLEPGLLAGPATRLDNPVQRNTGPAAGAVTVLAGDSLWDIVAGQLGPEASDVEIALEWPRWYAANREVIGPDPDVLLPGQVLNPPAAP
jgi:hypothetical protein